MLLPIIGICFGILIGFIFPMYIPSSFSQYVAVAILASLDSVFGGANARLHGKFDVKIFISGFFGNALLAAMLAYIGKGLGLDLYLAAVVVFGSRLFQNFAEIRRYLLKSPQKKDNI